MMKGHADRPGNHADVVTFPARGTWSARCRRAIGLAIRDEVVDLRPPASGIVQIDEAALPRRPAAAPQRLAALSEWATEAFRLCASGVRDET